jgi:hypothetical protein
MECLAGAEGVRLQQDVLEFPFYFLWSRISRTSSKKKTPEKASNNGIKLYESK